MTWQQKTTNNGRDCEHGHAHYKCPICERDEEIYTLRSALLAARDYVHHYDCSGYTKLGDLAVITKAREALRAKLKEIGL